MKYLFCVGMLVICWGFNATCQDFDPIKDVTVELKKKDYFSGQLVEITSDSIIIFTDFEGRMAFNKSEVRSVREGIRSPFFMGTTNSSVPYFVQTALPNGNGNHYYKNYYIFGNELNFGLTDNLNASIGFETITLFFDNGNRIPILQFGLKQCFQIQENTHIALSGKYYFNEEGSVYMFDVPFTFGNSSTNFTISPNLVFADGSKYFSIFSNFSLALSDRSRFVFDYGRVDGFNTATMLYEYTFKSGFALSVGGFAADEGAIPNIAFSIPFGRWKN